jgi:RNA polymerase sigma-70 factor (ECF subfamily)
LTSDDARIDPSIVAALYVEHADELRAFLIGVLKDPELAGEVLQAAFARAVEVGHTAREESRKGWLFKVAFNEAMLLLRRRKTHDASIEKIAWSRNEQQGSPEDHLTRWEDVERVRASLDELPPDQQAVVRMRIYEEKKFAAIAEELGLPLGTVLTRMRLALKKLAASLNPEDSNQ